MYNIDFLPQIEEFRRNFFGNRNPRDIHPAYFLPKDIQILECHEDANGEWVPPSALENKT